MVPKVKVLKEYRNHDRETTNGSKKLLATAKIKLTPYSFVL
jgi:hypothetical protein